MNAIFFVVCSLPHVLRLFVLKVNACQLMLHFHLYAHSMQVSEWNSSTSEFQFTRYELSYGALLHVNKVYELAVQQLLVLMLKRIDGQNNCRLL